MRQRRSGLEPRLGKKTAAAALALGATVSVTASTAAASAHSDVVARSSGSTSLVIYSADPANMAAYNKVDAAFDKANNVKTSIVSYPSSGFMQPYEAAIAGHAQINLLLANGQNIAFMHQHGQLVNLTGDVSSSTFRPSMLTPFTFNKQLYGAPVGGLSTTGVIYNKSLLAQYHLSPPTTFKQVIADGKILSAHGDSVFATCGGDIYLWPIWYMQTIEQATAGKPEQLTNSTVYTGKPAFTSGPYLEAMNALAELGNAPGVFEPGVNGVSETAAIALFDSGKAAMMYAGNWDLAPAVAGAKFPVGTEQFPTYVNGAPSGAAGGPSIVAAVYSGSPKADFPIEKKWIKYITSKAVDQELVNAEKAALPIDAGVQPPSSAFSGGQSGALNSQILDKFVPETFTFLDWTWPAKTVTAIQQDIQAVVGGQMTSKAALQDIQSSFTPVKS